MYFNVQLIDSMFLKDHNILHNYSSIDLRPREDKIDFIAYKLHESILMQCFSKLIEEKNVTEMHFFFK